jgi:hypothetical protein
MAVEQLSSEGLYPSDAVVEARGKEVKEATVVPVRGGGGGEFTEPR